MDDHFPVTYSTLCTKALATDLLPEYRLGTIKDCRLYSVGINDTYQVRTEEGGTYFLRVYRSRWRSVDDVQVELDALLHLHRQGIPVARPRPREDGQYIWELLAPEGWRRAVLFAGAPGEEPTYDTDPEAKAFAYGQAVARLHNGLQGFSSSHTRFHIDLDHLIDAPLRNIQSFLSQRPGDWAYLQRLAGTVRQRIQDLPAGALEKGFCHGDLQGFHHHIAGDGTLTFFDFDCCGFGYRAYDLAVFRWCSRLENQEQVWWEPYLRGYREVRPLNDLDIQAIPLFVCARYIWHMGLHTENAPDWGHGGLGDAYFDKRLGYLRAVEADYL
jgi:Ser/Thr protein kinase RdoA (MazF antagonist)